MSKAKKLSKYKVIKKKVERLEMEGTEACPECKSLMKKFVNWGYTEWECVGCGLTQTTERTRPE